MSLLSLNARDLYLLGEAQRALVKAEAFETPEVWKRHVNRTLCALIGAEVAVFEMYTPDGDPLTFSDEMEADLQGRFTAHFEPLSRRYRLRQRAARAGVLTRRAYWAPMGPAFERSPFYQECILPGGLYDNIMMSAEDRRWGGPPRERLPVASVYLDRRTVPHRLFGEREVELMRLLQPALQAGAEAALQAELRVLALGDLLNEGGGCAAAFTTKGAALHVSPALEHLLGLLSERDRARFTTAFQAVVLATPAYPLSEHASAGDRPALREVSIGTEQGVYRLSGTSVSAGPFGRDPIVIVRASRTSEGDASKRGSPDVARQFGLTAREAEVAALLVRRMTNAEIAAELLISPNTARRHTERVLEKLGITSRFDVGGRLSGTADSGE